MESYFEFNVSLNGRHLFATAPRSFPIYDTEKAVRFYNELCERFPESEGFFVRAERWICTGKDCTLEFIKRGGR